MAIAGADSKTGMECFPIVPYYDTTSKTGSLLYNECSTCGNPLFQRRRSHSWSYPDKAGCAICPNGEYPLNHRIGGKAHGGKSGYGTIECLKPKRTRKIECYPWYTKPALQVKGIQLPESCHTLGMSQFTLAVGEGWSSFQQWEVVCILWKHVFCIDAWDPLRKKHARRCAVTKRVKWAYVDSCPVDGNYKSGRKASFDYKACIADGCPSLCIHKVNMNKQPVKSPQVINEIKKLPRDLQDYDKTYGLCSRIAMTS